MQKNWDKPESFWNSSAMISACHVRSAKWLVNGAVYKHISEGDLISSDKKLNLGRRWTRRQRPQTYSRNSSRRPSMAISPDVNPSENVWTSPSEGCSGENLRNWTGMDQKWTTCTKKLLKDVSKPKHEKHCFRMQTRPIVYPDPQHRSTGFCTCKRIRDSIWMLEGSIRDAEEAK